MRLRGYRGLRRFGSGRCIPCRGGVTTVDIRIDNASRARSIQVGIDRGARHPGRLDAHQSSSDQSDEATDGQNACANVTSDHLLIWPLTRLVVDDLRLCYLLLCPARKPRWPFWGVNPIHLCRPLRLNETSVLKPHGHTLRIGGSLHPGDGGSDSSLAILVNAQCRVPSRTRRSHSSFAIYRRQTATIRLIRMLSAVRYPVSAIAHIPGVSSL